MIPVPEMDEALFQLTRGAVLLTAFLGVLALERWRPHEALRPAWGTNLGVWAIDALVMAGLCGACGWTVAAWADERGIGLLPLLDLGAGIAVAVGFVALDLVAMSWHVANHRVKVLWRFHRVHHADESFHATTALRFHPGELALALPVRLAVVMALGIPPVGVLAFELVFGAMNLLVHGNVDLPESLERGARRVLVTPALHRAHHAASWRALDTNFGTVLSLWDRWLGTLRLVDPAHRFATGLPDRIGRAAPALAESLRIPFGRG